ncbi:MAG: radical SAM protein [Candidatus Diapherotrites archaeon]
MKVLLALPRFEPNANPPLGVGYIAAVLKRNGFEVEVLDPTFEGWDFAVKRLKKPDFDVLGFSCYTMNVNRALELTAIAKKANPKLLAVFGGAHPSIEPEATIKEKLVDAVIIGEGEYTFLELAQALKKKGKLEGIRGLWFKKGKKIVRNPPRPLIQNLDELPFPARELFPMEKYLNAVFGTTAWAVKQPSTSIMAGRGCPFQCTYCSTKLVFGLSARFRSAKNVVEEIIELKEKYGVKGLNFVDDTFTLNRKVVEELCNELISRKVGVEWAAHTRVNNASLELFKKMKRAGCTVVGMGVESGNQFVLDNYIKKGIKLSEAENAFALAKKAGLITDAYFMIGIPGETRKNIDETIEYALKLNLDVVNFNITRPMPRTEMMEIAKKAGRLEFSNWDDFDFTAKPIYYCDEWTPEELQLLLKKAYRRFYFRPSYVLKQLFSIRGYSDIKRIFNGLQMVLAKS